MRPDKRPVFHSARFTNRLLIQQLHHKYVQNEKESVCLRKHHTDHDHHHANILRISSNNRAAIEPNRTSHSANKTVAEKQIYVN